MERTRDVSILALIIGYYTAQGAENLDLPSASREVRMTIILTQLKNKKILPTAYFGISKFAKAYLYNATSKALSF